MNLLEWIVIRLTILGMIAVAVVAVWLWNY